MSLILATVRPDFAVLSIDTRMEIIGDDGKAQVAEVTKFRVMGLGMVITAATNRYAAYDLFASQLIAEDVFSPGFMARSSEAAKLAAGAIQEDFHALAIAHDGTRARGWVWHQPADYQAIELQAGHSVHPQFDPSGPLLDQWTPAALGTQDEVEAFHTAAARQMVAQGKPIGGHLIRFVARADGLHMRCVEKLGPS